MRAQQFPEHPYLGLAQYGAKDSLLFAGRERHVDACAEIIAQAQTRILLLHGQTGCGKSSFLRAGLIPGLETRGWGYLFLRRYASDDDVEGEPVFIRCGQDPVANLARELYAYVSRPLQMQTALGKHSFVLSGALLGASSAEDFVGRCAEPQRLLDSLAELSRLQPSTLVMVLDQVEEVLNLNAPDSLLRARFFEFLKLFNVSAFNAKLVLCLRKDHSGEFIGLAQLDNKVQTDFKVYLLPEMTCEEVLRAITLPTSRDEIPGVGSPYRHYQFEFAPDVADRIVTDLFEAIPSGAILPVVQIVCKDLYECACRREQPWIIDGTLYQRSQLTLSVTQHISKSLRMSFGHRRLSGHDADQEELRWRKVLYRLVRYEGDGRVHTDVMSRSAFRDNAIKEGTLANADEVFNNLTHPDVLVLRRLTIPIVGRGMDEPMCSLGHDVVGLALAEMKIHDAAIERTEQKRRQRAKWVTAGSGMVLIVALSLAAWAGKDRLDHERRRIDRLVVQSAAARHEDATYSLTLGASAISEADSSWIFNAAAKSNAKQNLADLLEKLPTHHQNLPTALLGNPVAAGRSSLLTSPPGFVSVLAEGKILVARVTHPDRRPKEFLTDVPRFVDSTTMSTVEPFDRGILILLATYGADSDVDQRFRLFLLRDDAVSMRFTPKSLLRQFNVLKAAQQQQPLTPTRVTELSAVSLAADSVVLISEETKIAKALIVKNVGDSYFSAGAEIQIADAQPPLCEPIERGKGRVPPEQFIVGTQLFSAEFRPVRSHQCPVELDSVRASPLRFEGGTTPWQLSAADLPSISKCSRQGENRKCTYKFEYVNRMTVVTLQANEWSQSDAYGSSEESSSKSYVIIDSDTGNSKVVEDSELQDARQRCSAQPSSDPSAEEGRAESALHDGRGAHAYTFIEGTMDDIIFGFARRSSVQIVRIRPNRPIECIERLHLSSTIQQWRYAAGFNMLLALSDTQFLAWDLENSASRRRFDGPALLKQVDEILSVR
jgi:hypothetical protein